MYGHDIKFELSEFINSCAYPVEIPEYAFGRHEIYTQGVLETPSVPDKNHIVLSRVTIAMMIDYAYRKIPFKILLSTDIVEIYSYLQEYNSQLGMYESDSKEAAEYLVQSRSFANQLERSVRILSNKDPQIRKVLNRDKLTNLFDKAL